jgi:ParB family transcriptional regulator, chromosome partitioning protein
MTTSAAENRGEKEKVEKRRALGRGLDSLLPGPRAVPGAGVRPAAPPANVPAAPSTPAPQQIPPVGRNDNDFSEGAAISTSPMPAAEASTSSETETDPWLSDAPESADDGPIEIKAVAEPARVPGNLVLQLAISDIDKNPFQTRYISDDEKLEELALSIRANGVLQPIVVRPSEDDSSRYVLIVGERRLHASKKAGRKTIPAIVRRVSLQAAAEMTIVENLQRDDLSPLEQAQAFKVLSQEFSMTQAQIAERVGLSRESVANYMRLLKLPVTVMEMLAEKRINFAQAKELLKLGDNDKIAEAALYAVKKGMTIEQVETLVLRMEGFLDPEPGMPGQVTKKSGGARWVDPNVRAAQLELERLLGMRVRIRDRKGKGKIVIEYSTVDDYERVVEALRRK